MAGRNGSDHLGACNPKCVHHIHREKQVFWRPGISPRPDDTTSVAPRFGRRDDDTGGKTPVERVLYKILNKNYMPQKLDNSTPRWDWPLHVKNVGRIDWDKAGSLITPENAREWQLSVDIITKPSEWMDQLDGHEISLAEASISQQDLQSLLGFGIWEALPEGETVLGTCNIFTVNEPEKTRRRLISEPRINEELTYTPSTELPSVEQCVSKARTHGGSCWDFSSFYNQFEIPEEARNWFCARFKGKWYRSKVIPTGMRQCPALAQALTDSLAQMACANCETGATHEAYIDNVRFTGDAEATKRAADTFERLCEEVPITIGEMGTHLTDYTFLGIHYNHLTACVDISKKHRTKINELIHQLGTETHQEWTMRDVLRLVGILVWAFRVLDIQLAKLYYLLKFIRRRAHYELEQKAEFWPSLRRPTLQALSDCLGKNRHIQEEPKAAEIILFTDACEEGYGAVMFQGTKVGITAGDFEKKEPIHILEARALLYGIEKLPNFAKSTEIKVFIDNTSVLFALRKGASKSFLLNKLVPNISKVLNEKNVRPNISYVKSEENMADLPSRIGSMLKRL